MINFTKKFFLYLISFLIFSYCNNSKNEPSDSKNALCFEYSVKYLVSSTDNPIINLLPEKLFLYSKNNFFMYHTEGWGGFVSISQIIDTNDSTRIVMAKFMNTRYAHKQNKEDKALNFEVFDYKISDIERDTICFDRPCKCLDVFCQKTKIKLQLIFTDHFNIPCPNLFLPYSFIKGALLKYPLSTLGIPMEVELVNFKDTILDDSFFELPENFQIVDREEFEAVFEKYSPN